MRSYLIEGRACFEVSESLSGLMWVTFCAQGFACLILAASGQAALVVSRLICV